jgi:MoaA/NifB/PqqE/SkfB family radical SAM enzyme
MDDKKSGGIVISTGCVNRCPFCDFPIGYNPPKSEVKKMEVKILLDLHKFRKKGYTDLYISGSDPIEYDKLVPLTKYIKKLGFVNIHLSTHGRKLANKKFAEELVKAGINKFRFPLYGSTAEIHDSITQSEGSFEEIIQGIKNIREADPSIIIDMNTLVMKENKEDLHNMIKFVKKFNLEEFGISIMYIKDEESLNHYVPIKNLKKYVKDINFKENDVSICFFDIPYCIFGKYHEKIIMPHPPDLGRHNQPEGQFKSKIKDLPNYRLKTKTEICKTCKLSNKCDGFLVNDIDKYGTGDLRPIQ